MNRLDLYELIGVVGIMVCVGGAALGGAVDPAWHWLSTAGALVFAWAVCKADK